jgi:hypothetical protein
MLPGLTGGAPAACLPMCAEAATPQRRAVHEGSLDTLQAGAFTLA